MKQYQGRLVFGWWSRAAGITSTTAQGWPNTAELLPLRFMTAKAPNRPAVRGHRLPIPGVVDEEEVEKVIEKGKRRKKKRGRRWRRPSTPKSIAAAPRATPALLRLLLRVG